MNFACIQIPKICLCREIGCMRTFLKGHSNCCYTYDIGLASYVRAWLSRIMCKLLHSLRFYCCKVRLHCLKNVAMKCWDFIPESRYAESIFSFNLIKFDTWKLKASVFEEILDSVSLKPYLFTHPNPTNAIISWIISWTISWQIIAYNIERHSEHFKISSYTPALNLLF